jgi:predicted transposase YbfD/YdcC
VNQVYQWGGALWLAVKGVHKQFAEIVATEWCENNVLHCRSRLTDRF